MNENQGTVHGDNMTDEHFLAALQKELAGRSNIGGMLPMVKFFSGEPGGISLKDFVRDLNSASSLGHWTKPQIITVFKQRLTGKALDFFNSRPELEYAEWEELYGAMKSEFRVIVDKDISMPLFFRSKQEVGETACQFRTRLKLAGLVFAPAIPPETSPSFVEFTEEDKVKRQFIENTIKSVFIVGLRTDDAREYVELKNPTTLEDAVELATRYEQSKRKDSLRLKIIDSFVPQQDFSQEQSIYQTIVRQIRNELNPVPTPIEQVPSVAEIVKLLKKDLSLPAPPTKPVATVTDLIKLLADKSTPTPAHTSDSHLAQIARLLTTEQTLPKPPAQAEAIAVEPNGPNCFKCGGRGHFARVCPSSQSSSGQPFVPSSQSLPRSGQQPFSFHRPDLRSPSTVFKQCAYCKRTGHIISECRTRTYNNGNRVQTYRRDSSRDRNYQQGSQNYPTDASRGRNNQARGNQVSYPTSSRNANF